MKIVLTSDIHYGNLAGIEGTGPFDHEAHLNFAKEIHAQKPDVLIVTGDCAETCINENRLRDFLKLYCNPHGVSICIPGNHDVWLAKHSKMNHWQKYDWFFEQTQKNGWIGLRDVPWSYDGIYIAGSMGWYDFSTADPLFELSPEKYDQKKAWSDYVWMGMDSALEVCMERMKEFERSLSLVPNSRKKLIVISHIVGFSRLLTDEFRRPNNGDAFMGNTKIGELAVKFEANWVFCGHSHRRKEFELGNIHCINNGSGYGLGSKSFDILDL
jgi:3',5'-cyclic AMP phosphodiesterase CpdA